MCYQRSTVFRATAYAELMVETMYSYRHHGKYSLHEFVLMHDHIHVLITPAEHESLEKTMQHIKGGFSFRVGRVLSSKKEIWQRSFTHDRVSSAEAYAGFRRYIHENPVRARYCAAPAEYLFSSANEKYELDPPVDYLRG